MKGTEKRKSKNRKIDIINREVIEKKIQGLKRGIWVKCKCLRKMTIYFVSQMPRFKHCIFFSISTFDFFIFLFSSFRFSLLKFPSLLKRQNFQSVLLSNEVSWVCLIFFYGRFREFFRYFNEGFVNTVAENLRKSVIIILQNMKDFFCQNTILSLYYILIMSSIYEVLRLLVRVFFLQRMFAVNR